MSDNLFSLSPIALSMGADPTDFLRLYKNVRFTHDEVSIEENENVSPLGSAIFPSPTTLPELGPFNQWVDRLSSASEIFDSSTSGPYNAMLLRGFIDDNQPKCELREQLDRAVDLLTKMLAVHGMLMPGVRHIAVPNYAMLNDVPMAVREFVAKIESSRINEETQNEN